MIDLGDGFYAVRIKIRHVVDPDLTLTAHLRNRFDILQRLNTCFPNKPVVLGESVFYLFREIAVSATISTSRFRLFQIMLNIGQGSFDALLGHLIITRSVELVRRVYI